MTNAIETRLSELGLTLPEAPAPAANYLPFVQSGQQIFISGQLPTGPDGLITGKLGADLEADAGAEAAKYCALALLAQARKAANGDLGRVRLIKLVGFVNSTADFADQPKVVNGASDLMVHVLGDHGRHARSAVSAASLPFGVAVEVEAIFELL